MTGGTKRPLVSVVISCFNAERWLNEAVNSVLTQTFSDFELILVDDGSTDNTWDSIEIFRANDRRVVGLRKANTGLTASLNTALGLARGKWIARMDADDICEPTRLEEQVGFAAAHPEVILLGSGFTEIDSSGKTIKTHRYPKHHAALVWHLEHMARFFPHSSAFFRLSEALRVKGYNTRFQRAQDWRLWLDLSTVGSMACLRRPLVRIRKHSGQISLTGSGTRQLFDAMAGTVGHLLRKAGYPDPCVDGSEEQWVAFLRWIENRVEETGLVARHRKWNDVRTELLDDTPGYSHRLRSAKRLFSSGYAMTLIVEHLFGLSLPNRLKRDWIEACAA